jgi:hypothetical protein
LCTILVVLPIFPFIFSASMTDSSVKFRVEPLQGEADYLDWSNVMVNVFKTEGVYRYVSGVVTEPVVPALAADSGNAAAVTAADALHDKWESDSAAHESGAPVNADEGWRSFSTMESPGG